MSIRMPRLLDGNLKERARLHPIRLSLNLTLSPLSTAEMVLADSDADISVRDFVELYDEGGSVGIFRVSEIDCQPGLTRTVRLEHGLCTLSDGIIGTMNFVGTIPECIDGLLGWQSDIRWISGDCDVPADTTVLFTCACEDVLSALARLLSLLPTGYALDFDQSGTLWKLHLHALSDEDACEGRLSRNLTDVRITTDASSLCTRVYPFGAGQGTERVSLYPLTGEYHLQSEAAATWGIISRTFTAPAIYDSLTLRDVAQRYLALHGEPTVSITAQAIDLSAITGEEADSFRLGRMCRLNLDGNVLHERVIALEKPDVYGAPGQTTVTLCSRIRDTSDEIAALLRDVTADKLMGGRVSEVKHENRAEGTTSSPIVHYFPIGDWAALLDARFSFEPDSGVTVTQVRIDDSLVPDDVWQGGSFSGLSYLAKDELGLPTVGTHRFILYPSTGTLNELAPVESTVTMKVIETP